MTRQVGIVIPNFNKRDYIAETIRSVLAQSHDRICLVVVDDGSTDDSLDVIRSVIEGTDAVLVELANGGVSRARNAGFAALPSAVDDVMFLDSDDLLEHDAIARLSSHLGAHPRAGAVYARATLIDESGASLGPDPDIVRWVPGALCPRRLTTQVAATPLDSVYSRFRALPSATMLRASVFERTGGWEPGLCRPARPFQVEDKDMAVQIALLSEVHWLDELLYRYRVLPTVHRPSVYEGLHELDRKWWNAPLQPAVRRRVRRAIRFDRRVATLDAVRSVGSGGVAGVPAATVGAIRHLLAASTVGLRLRREGPPPLAAVFPDELR
jgi:glycosyltransferase involved in cell wall biosynthesis